MIIAFRIWSLVFLLVIVAAASPASSQKPSGPIQITKGGTYSGNWSSNDPKISAVTIHTDQPVIIKNSVITSRGNLISLSGVKSGANVTVENVTGTALDPGVKGLPRGAFVWANGSQSLIVKNCTMRGVSFGVLADGGTPSTLKILNNSAINLEDRASDGKDGFLPTRPRLGHFVILVKIAAPDGAEIAWNQVVQTIGLTSTEDVINIYESQGSKAHPIWVHDNYIEGSSSPFIGKDYTGTALIADGSSVKDAPLTAYVLFEKNQIVATAGTGIGIAYGHDITARANRVVSCGDDGSGKSYAWGASAVVIWNIYKSPQFYNNTISGTVGGMVGPGPNHRAKAYDTWVGPSDKQDLSNSIRSNDFTDPCFSGGTLNLHAEDAERAYWTKKISNAHELIGDQHTFTQ